MEATLEDRILELQTQMHQVKAALITNPQNPELLDLQTQLQSALKIIQDLSTLQQVSGTEVVQNALHAGSVLASQERANETQQLQVGSSCQAVSAGEWYPAVVRAADDRTGRYTVEFFGFNSTTEVDFASVRPLSRVRVGAAIRAFYAGDLKWYDAELMSANDTDGTCKVRYKGFKTVEEVPAHFIAPSTKPDSFKRTLAKVESSAAAEAIPESLQIKSTDTDETKANKKKRVHAIKGRNRLREIEDERNTRQSAWNSFQNSTKNKKIGFMAKANRTSIFRSPDSVDGKVGVTNSGKDVTEFVGGYKYKPDDVKASLAPPRLEEGDLLEPPPPASTSLLPVPSPHQQLFDANAAALAAATARATLQLHLQQQQHLQQQHIPPHLRGFSSS